MDEQAGFEARAVLAPRHPRRARLTLVLPVVALAAIAWAGVNGARSEEAIAVIPDPTAFADASPTVERFAPEYPAQALGIDVQRLDDVQPQSLGRDNVIAVAGWYVPKAITDCPSLPALYRDGALPNLRGDADTLVFCVRSGVLYASRPASDEPLPTNDLNDEGRSNNGGLPSIATTLVVGVIAPLELETVGTDATEVVLLGRFVDSGDTCRIPSYCPRQLLLVDHVAWTPGA